jgi:outer membrane receptor protein involved in Fe transport
MTVFTRSWRVIPVLILLSIMASGAIYAQQMSEIRGKITDSSSVEPLIGATIVLKGTTLGASTDLEGHFVVRKVPPGTYELHVSMIGYAGKAISGVVVKPGEPVTLNIALAGTEVSVDEVVVTADAVRSTESAVLMERKKAGSIGDGMSEEQIKKTPDANTAEVVRRIPSVTIVDNKFLQVRGSSERYNSAMLNNTAMSSTEPEKKSFALDLFPSNLIENAVLTKSFTPDLPGDFSGGLLKINTVDFPDAFTLNAGAGVAYNTVTTNRDFLTYSGGDPTYGSDAGIRNLPAGFPENLSIMSPSKKLAAGKSLINIWAPRTDKAHGNGNYSLGIGDQFPVFGQTLGVVASVVSRTSYANSDIERNDYMQNGSPKFLFKGSSSKYSVMSGAVANIGLKLFDRHKISFKSTITRGADDETIVLNGLDFDAGFYEQASALRYVSHEVVTTQLIGDHSLPVFSGLDLEWRLSRSLSLRNEPDYRRVYYARDLGSPNDPMFAVLGPEVNLKNGGRFYSDMNDEVRGAGVDLSTPVLGAKVKFGGLYQEQDRNFASRLIGMLVNAPGNGYTDFALLYLPPDSIFAPQNFRQNGFSVDEYTNGSNRYYAGQIVRAGYVMVDHLVDPLNLRFILGARLENSTSTIRSRDLTNTTAIDVSNAYVDVLPSVNLVYTPHSSMNVRAAYSQTINRPELRELAPFSYYDFATQFSLTGNPYLGRALIRNYDLRAEFFPGIGEVVSVSVFYKGLTDAIEQVIQPSAALNSERTFLNAERAINYGAEFEARKNLSFIGSYFGNFLVNFNYSWIRSQVNFGEVNGAVETKSRPLQGQSPYVVNAGLTYTEPNIGTSLSVLYNRFGKRITEVSTQLEEDIYEQPRNLLDLVIGQTFAGRFDLKLAARDLLREPQLFMQGDKVVRKNSVGAGISLGLSVRY